MSETIGMRIPNQDQILLTVVTVVKNALEPLRKTYASLRTQGDVAFRWLVVDGLSNDGTQDWLQSLSPDEVRFVSGKDKSIYDAMNKAVGLVETAYFLFLNAGDTLCASNVLARVLAELSHNNPDLCYGKCIIMAGGGFPSRERGGPMNRMGLFYGKLPCHQATIVSKRAFLEVGTYNDSMRVYADREWLMRLTASVRGGHFVYLDFPIVNYDPSGYSYQRFFSSKGEYFRMIWKHGNAFEIAWGILGWMKAAVHNIVSKSGVYQRG